MRLATACLILLLATVPARAADDRCEGIGASCALNDLGNGQFEYVFTVTNSSAESNAVFFWVVDNPLIPASWVTIAFDVPDGWTGSHPGQQLHFSATNNGDGNPFRIYSPSASSCGATSYEFRWTFTNEGGPTPECNFGFLDYTFHAQGVDAACANVGSSFVCPSTVPVEPVTWGTIKGTYAY